MQAFFNRPRVPEVTVDEVAAQLDAESQPFLLDVREQEEWDEAHIEQATLIPLGQLRERLDEVPPDREIVCICRSGQRSAIATQALMMAGFSARNMSGGMLDWIRRGHPVKHGG